MKAVYITYDIETGEVEAIQTQHKGVAPKVADWPRKDSQSVMRVSQILPTGIPDNYTVVDGENCRELWLGDSKVADEDLENSVIWCQHIEALDD